MRTKSWIRDPVICIGVKVFVKRIGGFASSSWEVCVLIWYASLLFTRVGLVCVLPKFEPWENGSFWKNSLVDQKIFWSTSEFFQNEPFSHGSNFGNTQTKPTLVKSNEAYQINTHTSQLELANPPILLTKTFTPIQITGSRIQLLVRIGKELFSVFTLFVF